MWRREFIAGLASTVAFPLATHAQTPNRIYRLAHLANSSDSEAFTRQITLPELAKLGFAEGRNLVFDARVGEPDALPGLMRELLAGERCSDHFVAAYLAKVNAMKRQFLRLAANGRN